MNATNIENGILQRIARKARDILHKEKRTAAGNGTTEDRKEFDIRNGILMKYRGTDEDVIIPEGVTRVGPMAFYGRESIYSVTFPESVTSIGDSAFDGCVNLYRIVLPDGLARIGRFAFHGCSSLRNAQIPNKIIWIGEMAFHGCFNLKSVVLSKGVSHSRGWKFLDEIRLRGVLLPEDDLSIGDGAFNGCSSLSSIEIPESIVRIGKKAFYYCSSLDSVKIPEGVANIGDRAFDGCNNLRNVFFSTPSVVSGLPISKDLNLFYLGGPLADLPEDCREPASRGFLNAQEQSSTDFDGWRAEYLEYIRNHAGAFVHFPMKNKFYLFFFIREELLDENGIRQLLDQYESTDDVETKAALLQYQHEKFGTGDTANFAL